MKSKAKYTQARPRDRVREQEEACCNAWGRLQRQQFFPALPSGLTQAPRVEAGEYRRRFFFFFPSAHPVFTPPKAHVLETDPPAEPVQPLRCRVVKERLPEVRPLP